MAESHRILRRISGLENLKPGDKVDATGWRNLDKLVDQRYLEPLVSPEPVAVVKAASPAAPPPLAAVTQKQKPRSAEV